MVFCDMSQHGHFCRIHSFCLSVLGDETESHAGVFFTVLKSDSKEVVLDLFSSGTDSNMKNYGFWISVKGPEC